MRTRHDDTTSSGGQPGRTRITRGAAAGAMGWMRRLSAHPAVAAALAAGELSGSWARAVCAWTDLLPAECRADADAILLGRRRRTAPIWRGSGGAGRGDAAADRPARTRDGDDGFTGRSVQLDVTFGQAGKLDGDLTPQCTAALSAVLDALGKRAGPEDLRTAGQRRHDALEEACRRLIAAGCLPDRAGQPTQIQVHMTLDQLRGLARPGAEAAWAAAWPPAAPGADCDASIVPVVTGHLNHQLLDQLAAALLRRPARHHRRPPQRQPGQPAGQPGPGGHPGPAGTGGAAARDHGRRLRAERAARRLIVSRAAACCRGPAGWPPTCGPGCPTDLAASVSLPLDIGAATDTIPVHLRRAVTARDRHCRFPGCPPARHRLPARTTSSPAPKAAPPAWPTCSTCAPSTTSSPSTGGAGASPSILTAPSPPPAPTARTLHCHSPPATAA